MGVERGCLGLWKTVILSSHETVRRKNRAE